jgi:hypothetical protein
MVDFAKLAAPFDPSEVLWRVGSMTKDKKRAMALAYMDARVVMERLDSVCGPASWQCRYSHANGKTVCDIAIKCGDEWVWKADGAGDSDIEAEKGALSDAFKRAAVRWGVGRYLYEIASPWVEVDEWKKIKDHEYTKLENILINHARSLPDAPPRATAPKQSSDHGRALAAQEPQLVDHTRQKGTVTPPATGQTPAEERAAKVKAATDKRISALKSVTGWTRPTLDQFWADNQTWIEWMANPDNGFLPEYERFSNAFADAEVNMREAA